MVTRAELDPAVSPLLPGPSMIAGPIVNAYIREVLGKKTYGRVLNIGAGGDSENYRYDLRLKNTEYHTVEISGDGHPTYVADARDMPQVPSASYDWVVSFAVLEHIDDMRAVVREVSRVLKPDGCVYFRVPFHYNIHFNPSYGDYWRISPFGFHALLDSDFSFEEVEYWGDCVIDPSLIGVLARKGAAPAQGVSRLYYIEGGYDSINTFISGDRPFRWLTPIWQLKKDGLEYCLDVARFRSQFFTQTGQSLTTREADKMLFHQVGVLEGTIVISNEESRLVRPHA